MAKKFWSNFSEKIILIILKYKLIQIYSVVPGYEEDLQMRIPVRRAWMGLLEPPEPDEGKSRFYIISLLIFCFYHPLPIGMSSIYQLNYTSHSRGCKAFTRADRKCESRSAHRSLPLRRSGLRCARYRTWSRPSIVGDRAARDVDQAAAQFAHYRESEDKPAPFRRIYPPLRWRAIPRDTFVPRGAIGARDPRRDTGNTRKSISGESFRLYILHLWRRANVVPF